MTENLEDKDRLDRVVRSKMKGLGLDALFHQVDVSRKDEDRRAVPPLPEEEKKLLEKLKKGFASKQNYLASPLRFLTEKIRPRPSTVYILDIGTASIKSLKLHRDKKKISIKGASFLPVPMAAVNTPEKSQKFITEAIGQMIDLRRAERSTVVSLLPRTQAIVKFLVIPSEDASEVKKMLTYEAEHHLPLPLADVEIDYAVLKKEARKTQIILAAVKKEVIAEHLGLLEKAGLKPDAIEISAIALYNASRDQLAPHGLTAQVSIGAAFTDINIARNGSLEFSRGLHWGSRDLTLALTDLLHLNFDDAEKIKKENGILLTQKEENPTQKIISDAARSWADRLAAEIEQTIRQIQMEKGLDALTEVMLCGGGARLMNLNEYLRERLKSKVAMQRIPPDLDVGAHAEVCDKYSLEMNALIGPVVQAGDEHKVTLNLIPEDIKSFRFSRDEKTKTLASWGAMALAAAILFCFPLLLIVFRNLESNGLDRRLKSLRPAAASVQELKDAILTIEDYTSAKQSCMEALREISLAATVDVAMDRFSFEKNDSVAHARSAGSHASAVNFSKALSESKFFENVRLKYTSRINPEDQEKEDVSFEIICELF
jgi:type IV pilus assembly protein PilM